MAHPQGKYADFEGLRERAVALRREGLNRLLERKRTPEEALGAFRPVEGWSYCRRERLHFINSDPNVISFFLRWLDVLDVERERLRYRVSIHESANATDAETPSRSTTPRRVGRTPRRHIAAA